MRPMPPAVDNVTGAFTPHDLRFKAIDTVKREQTKETLVPCKNGTGVSPAYGTFIDLQKTKYGVNRFFKTAPIATFPLRPRLPGVRQQVTNPAMLTKMPGYTGNVNVVQTQIGRTINKPYTGQY